MPHLYGQRPIPHIYRRAVFLAEGKQIKHHKEDPELHVKSRV